MEAFAIIVLVILLITFVLAVIRGVKHKTLIDKNNLFFFIPLFLILVSLYVASFLKVNGSLTWFDFVECLANALAGFKLEIKGQYIKTLAESFVIIKIDVIFAVIFAGLSVISGVLGFFEIGINNAITRNFKMSFIGKADIVLGYNDNAIKYVANHKHSVLWIDSKQHKLNSDDKKKLYLSNITYYYSPLNYKKLVSMCRISSKDVHIICFQIKSEYLNSIVETIKEFKTKKYRTYYFHVQTNGENITFVDSLLSKSIDHNSGVVASSFDFYELITRKFSNEYNFARYLPRDFYKEGAIKDGYEINVVMLGFGKTSNALLKGLIMNNQFAYVKDNKYHVKKINYHLFDKRSDSFKRSTLSFFKNFDELNKQYEISDKEFELPCNIYETVCDINSDLNKDLLKCINVNDKTYTYYFICLDNSLDNARIASLIGNMVNKDKGIIFYNIDEKKEIIDIGKDNVIPFGFKNIALSRSFIIDDSLWDLAALQNQEYYLSRKEKIKDIQYLPIIEKLSNIYANINLRFKLNQLGFDYGKDGVNEVTEEEYLDTYDPIHMSKNRYDYSNYFILSIRNALAFQEHLRWSLLYLLYGFTRMQCKDIVFNQELKKPIHKDMDQKRHACLVSYYELDNYHHYILNLYKSNGIDKKLQDVETYVNDYLLLDTLFKNIISNGYKLRKIS